MVLNICGMEFFWNKYIQAAFEGPYYDCFLGKYLEHFSTHLKNGNTLLFVFKTWHNCHKSAFWRTLISWVTVSMGLLKKNMKRKWYCQLTPKINNELHQQCTLRGLPQNNLCMINILWQIWAPFVGYIMRNFEKHTLPWIGTNFQIFKTTIYVCN